ncbi:DNA helicase UvrD [Candidatus Woesearchaeota archaeon]|nr:DNA helicase UvrD [Candidatus Woesearchaeota archaeon]
MIVDLHIHGKYAKATSKDLTIPMLEKYGKMKGVDIIGTGDAQHPQWNAHLKDELSEIGTSGIYQSKGGQKFLLTTEISFAYTQGGKGRRIHLVVLMPSIAVVDQVATALLKKGRIDYDGRPIFGMSCIEFVDMMRAISPDIEIIPAHVWTPWFGLFGSKSGFNSLQECFQDRTKHIHAIETGMSSDPSMNWRLSQLDNIQLVSFSDSHSHWPWRLGREATILDCPCTYKDILHSIRTGEGLTGTIETDPGYGIYHFDGHRDCGISYSPEESKKRKGICSKCGKPVTVGVAARIEELADRPEGFRPKNAKPHQNLIPLSELICGVLGVGLATKKTWAAYNDLMQHFPNEFFVLRDATKEQLLQATTPEIVDIILKNRKQEIKVKPGYDGAYGIPLIGKRLLKIEQENPSGLQEKRITSDLSKWA